MSAGLTYICEMPQSVEEQREEGFKTREAMEPWPLTLPMEWSANPVKEGNWRFQLHSWRMTDPLLIRYFESGEESYLHEALTFVEDWHRFHFVEKRSNQYSWYDMATGIRAMRLAFFIDMARNEKLAVSSDQIAKLQALSAEHVRRIRKAGISDNNHGLFQVAGLGLLCTVVSELPECSGAIDFARDELEKLLKSQISSEGIDTENSPYYHFFVWGTLRDLGAFDHFAADLVQPLRGKMETMRDWLVFPNGEISRVGDSWGKARPDVTLGPVGDFTKTGYAIVRDGSRSMLFVSGMAHTVTHKHADELSFELFEFGRFIFVDAGKYGYKSTPQRRYALSADAHNTISLGDIQLMPTDVVLAGSLLQPIETFKEGAYRIVGRVERPGFFDLRREISYQPGRSLIVTDTLSSNEEWQYVSSLHLAPDLMPVLTEGGFEVAIGDNFVKARLAGEDCSLSVCVVRRVRRSAGLPQAT
jgi:hypothetical protein